MIQKKQVLLFVTDGFFDWETAYALTCIRSSGRFIVRTMAMDKAVRRSSSGLLVVPDLDFIPEVDLKDIDATNTSLLIVSGAAWETRDKHKVDMLVSHCFHEGITIAVTSDAKDVIGVNPSVHDQILLSQKDSHPLNFSNAILEVLGVEHASVRNAFEGAMFG